MNKLVYLIVAGATVAATAGCGDDDTSTAAAPDVSAACATLVEIRTDQLDHESPTLFADLAEFADRWTEFAEHAGDTPAADAARTTATVIEDAVANEDVTTLYGPEGAAAEQRIDAWAYDECGFAQVPVTIDDESIEAGQQLAAGPTVLRIDNSGESAHTVTINRIRDDVTETPEEVLASDFDALFGKIEVISSGSPVDAGQVGYLVTQLRPGRHLLVDPSSDGAGAPAFMSGVWAAVVVK